MTTSPDLCSLAWDDADTPAWGTAKAARVIVTVEVAGAWGRDAVGDAGLRQPKGATLYAIRRVGRHAATRERSQVYVSGGFGGEPWLVGGALTAAEVDAFLAGAVDDVDHQAAFGMEATSHPVLLVCTNGKRDACCAVRARPVALSAHEAAPDAVWEVSHIGGHRFAPTAIHLPSGQTFGRLSDEGAAALAAATVTDESIDPAVSQLFSPTTHRGRVDLTPPAQVAETWWRERHTDLPLTPVTGIAEPIRVGDDWHVGLPDGSALAIASVPGPTLRDSCLKAPKSSSHFVVRGLVNA